MKKKLIFITLALYGLLWADRGHTQTPPGTPFRMDSVTSKPIYFPQGRAVIDRDYLENNQALRELDSILTDSTIMAGLDSIRINAVSSPEGSAALNKRLALQRAMVLSDYITTNFPTVERNRIRAEWSTANWRSLRSRLATDKNMPYRTEVLGIIDNSTTPAAMEAQLQRVANRQAWSYLTANYLKYMRYDEVQVIYRVPEPLPAEPTPVVLEPVRDTITVVREIISYQVAPAPAPVENYRKPLFALKTNLLFDLATALNIEVEVPIGQRWSIMGEYVFPWWLWKRKQIALEMLSGSIEGRYWFGDRTTRPQLTGWFLGVYIGGGYYDLEWKKKGYQGEFVVPGISGGYAHKIGRNLSMEYSLSLGVVRTKYRQYEAIENGDDWCLQRVKRDNATWIGPTKVKVSLVWMINTNKKRDAR